MNHPAQREILQLKWYDRVLPLFIKLCIRFDGNGMQYSVQVSLPTSYAIVKYSIFLSLFPLLHEYWLPIA